MSTTKTKKTTAKKKTAPKKASATPVQLTIAAYGKKKKTSKKVAAAHDNDEEDEESTSLTHPTEESESGADMDEEVEVEVLEETPIVLSLPVSDAMEDKFNNPNTLDNELTRYRPVLNDQAPMSLVSGSEGSRIYPHHHQHSKEPKECLVVKRCPTCVDKPGPCQPCQDKFNVKFKRSLSDYESARKELDDHLYHSQKPAFENVQINDEPLPKDFKPPVYHYRKGIEGALDPRELEQQPKGFVESGWDLEEADGGASEMTQQQREQYQQQELDRLRRKVAMLEDMLATAQTTGHPVTERRPIIANIPECMWHMEPFYTEPVRLPIHYDAITGKFEGMGCFCSLKCAYAYRLEHRSAEAAPLHLLFKAHRQMQQQEREEGGEEPTETAFQELLPAPPRQALKRWGGHMDIEEFLDTAQVWHKLSRRPFVPTEEFIETSGGERKSSSTTQVRAPSEHNNDGLVRRRDKPHPNAANQWNNAITRSRLRR